MKNATMAGLAVITIVALMLCGCASKDIVTTPTHNNIDTWIAQVENDNYKLDPMQPVGFKDSNFSGWNKFWMGAALIGQTGDVVSTAVALDRGGCREANPMFGNYPEMGPVLAVKLLVFGGIIWLAEYYMDGDPRQQNSRNWLYGSLAVLGIGATAWNSSLDCD